MGRIRQDARCRLPRPARRLVGGAGPVSPAPALSPRCRRADIARREALSADVGGPSRCIHGPSRCIRTALMRQGEGGGERECEVRTSHRCAHG